MDGFGAHPDDATAARLPQPVHPDEEVTPAPADLELLRSFLYLHDHVSGDRASLPPDADSLRWWLQAHGFVADGHVSAAAAAWALEVRAALVAKIREPSGRRHDDSTAVLNQAAERAALRICFGCADDRRIHVDADGVEGAIGALLGAAFLAELDGRWKRFRVCDDPTCSEVFYDHSRNRSGRWCSMATCGNRNKVRAFRERQRRDNEHARARQGNARRRG
jgi:predicted RNA-binding Zn ribbon-like protein